MINKLIKNLESKHKAFIGNRKDQITSANAEGFKEGLKWAIDVAYSIIEQAEHEHNYNMQELEREKMQSSYYYDEAGNCDGLPR